MYRIYFIIQVLCPVPWFNLRHMQYQPNSAHGPHGYLLSRNGTFLDIPRQAMYKDNSGIIRYKECFQLSRQGLHSVKTEENEILPKSDGIIIKDLKVETEPEETDQQPKNVKRKISSALMKTFRSKTLKIEDFEDDAGAISSNSVRQVTGNLKLADAEKVRYVLFCVPGERECLEVYFGDSFIGGSCLKINPSDEMCPEHRLSRLFYCDFLCREALVACVVTKQVPGHMEQHLNVILFMKDARDEALRVVLVGRNIPEIEDPELMAEDVMHVYPLNASSDEGFRDLQRYLLLNDPGFYVPTENSYDWNVRYVVYV